MELTHIDLESGDIDWFAADKDGHLGFFTTGGCGPVPRSVCASNTDLKTVQEFFWNHLPLTGEAIESTGWETRARVDPSDKVACALSLKDFVAMARRGLFSFDADAWAKRPVPYFRIAMPSQPARIDSLPPHVHRIVERTILESICFADAFEVRADALGEFFV